MSNNKHSGDKDKVSDEIVAVITVAISQMHGSGFVIRSIKASGSDKNGNGVYNRANALPTWTMAGRRK